jgi:hypothetical protein
MLILGAFRVLNNIVNLQEIKLIAIYVGKGAIWISCLDSVFLRKIKPVF